MTILGWIALALLVGYWMWMLLKKTPTVSYIFPGIVTLVLGGLAVWSFMSPAAASSMTGGRRSRYY